VQGFAAGCAQQSDTRRVGLSPRLQNRELMVCMLSCWFPRPPLPATAAAAGGGGTAPLAAGSTPSTSSPLSSRVRRSSAPVRRAGCSFSLPAGAAEERFVGFVRVQGLGHLQSPNDHRQSQMPDGRLPDGDVCPMTSCADRGAPGRGCGFLTEVCLGFVRRCVRPEGPHKVVQDVKAQPRRPGLGSWAHISNLIESWILDLGSWILIGFCEILPENASAASSLLRDQM